MNNDEIINILKHDKLKFKELLELYKNYLINIRTLEDKSPKFESDFDYYYANSLYTNCYAVMCIRSGKLQFLIKIVKLNPCGVLFADCDFILAAVILNCDLTVGIIL